MESYSQRPALHTRSQCSNHLFNSHHIELISSKNQTVYNSKMVKTEKNSQKEYTLLKNSFKLSQTPRTDFFRQAIEQVSSYYKKIELQIEKYKNQEINKLLQLKKKASIIWKSYGNKSIKYIRSPQFKRKAFSQKENYEFSPLIEGQNILSSVDEYVKNLKQSINHKMKHFSLIGNEWLKLTGGNEKQNNKDSIKILKDKVQVLRLRKQNLFLDLSQIEKSTKDIADESFVSKKAFRQLFPEDDKTTTEDTSSF